MQANLLHLKSCLQLKQALRDYHILIFKELLLFDVQLLDFAFYFGSLYVPPDDIPVLASKGRSYSGGDSDFQR